MDLLSDLNDEQRAAVERTEGPLLVLAGAGSGKTRVLVHRLAHILAEDRAAPEEIVAVTFTNKAAEEMRSRVAALLGASEAPSRVGTFHALCLRVLRREAGRVGYGNDFQVFDADDALRLVKECLKGERVEEASFPPRDVLRWISSVKNRGLDPEEAASRRRGGDVLAAVHRAYQESLARMNAMDFDDLILNVLRLLERDPGRRAHWAGSCRYLLVDEYQDTNPPQYRLVKALSSVHGNVCAVGDEDQSIYQFRGADIGNILSFQWDFPGAVVVKLTRNYRSTGGILEAANSLVRRNERRIGKELWTEEGAGERVRFTLLRTDRDEAAFVLETIRGLRGRCRLEETAILYRTNAQSRLFEEALVAAGVPYRIYGGLRFYDRREVRDLMSYLRLAANPADDIAFRRAVGAPPRGIGAAALEAIEEAARKAGACLSRAAEAALAAGRLPARAAAPARAFLDLIARIRERAGTASPADLLRDLIEKIGYEDYLRRADPADAASRIENVSQLVAAAEESRSEGLQAFLDRASLLSETESAQGDRGVSLMTLHAAKGLEFHAVLLVGMEEGLLPHERTLQGDGDLEEERRLCYVGMTRARRLLHLTAAAERSSYGRPAATTVSRFVEEIGEERLAVRDLRALAGASAGGPGRPRRPRGTALGDEDVSRHADEDEEGYGGGFRVGGRVRHEALGVGRVLAVEPAGVGLKLTVRFSGGRTVKVLTRAARLTPLPS
jgi:DNA helicase-2/ATP-dependent DNA helicase PcrA